MAHQYFAFQWHITDECDQRCKHCYIFAEGHPALVTMNRERMEQVFYNALEFCQTFNRLPYFYITGGDPILHPHFWFLLSLMKELAAEGMTMAVVTPEMNFAREVADKILFMDEGIVAEKGTPDEIFNHPQNKRLQQFLQRVL